MKNNQVCEHFANGDTSARTKNLFIETDILFSYGRHYPLCIRLKDGFILNVSGYSQTTSQHTGHLVRAITNLSNFKELERAKKNGDYKHIIFMDTQNMSNLIYDFNKPLDESNFKDFSNTTIQDLINKQVLNNL